MNLEIKEYYDNLAPTYDTNRFENSYGKFIDTQERLFLTRRLKNSKTDKILDLGCGTGRLLEFANYGVDVSRNMIEIAKSKFPEKEILEGTVTSIPITDKSLDCIFCFHVIMHLDQETTIKFLSETHNKLENNGRLIFDFPSKKRRSLFNFKSENWHAANSFSFEDMKQLSKNEWNIKTKQGILFLPIHRFPVFLRSFILRIDTLLCKTFLKEYASYLVIELQKNEFKKHIPKSLKVNFQLLKRRFNDYNYIFSTKGNEKIDLNHQIETIQEIKNGSYFENKVHNFHYVSNQISSIIIYPNEVFSFWKIIGNPNNNKNFKVGRNLVNGKISEEVAGGICQVSSILYHTALKTDLEIIERHNHSIDIYSEEDRFTPLGADATIVFPYKDLRIKNNYDFPITFSLKIKENEITCILHSQNQIREENLEFVRDYYENTICVSTIKNSEVIKKSIYKKF